MAMADPDRDEIDEDTELVLGNTSDGRPYTLPVEDVLTGRGFITGKSGAGKSNTGSVVAEELLDRGHPLLVVDVDGEYWGLKEEYEVLHVGATEECDLQVGAEHAEKLASLALESHVPIILDVSGYVDQDEGDALVRETARELFALEQQAMQPFVMLVEEVHEYIPQQGSLSEAGEMLIRVAKRGRKRGLGIIGLSQRPADVQKDFITQADLLVWHRLTWDNDTSVVDRVVGSEYADKVSDLADGEAFVQADWYEADVEQVQVRRKETFDAGATPGLDDTTRPELKSIGEGLVDELEEISTREEQRQDRVQELEATIEEREARIDELEQELENQEDIASAAQQMANALQGANGSSDAAGMPEDFDAKLEAKNDRIHELEETLDDVRGERDQLQSQVEDLEAEVERLQGIEERITQAERIEDTLAEARDVLGVDVEHSAPVEGDTAELREELRERDERIEELEQRLANAGEVTVPSDYHEFVKDDVVQDVIDEAKAESSASPRYVKGVVAAVLEEGGPVDYQTVADSLGVSDSSNVSKAASTLQAMGVLERVQQSPAKVDFDLEGVEEIKAQQRRREQTESVMEDL